MATPTPRSGKPTKAHQKYLGISYEPKEDNKLPNPMTVRSRPNPAMVGRAFSRRAWYSNASGRSSIPRSWNSLQFVVEVSDAASSRSQL